MRPSSNMLTDTLTVVRPATQADRTGNTIPDWDHATRTTTRGRIAARGGLGPSEGEVNAQRDAQVGSWVGYFPPEISIDGTCRVERGADTFDVIGPPYIPTTTSGPSHVVCTLRSVTG